MKFSKCEFGFQVLYQNSKTATVDTSNNTDVRGKVTKHIVNDRLNFVGTLAVKQLPIQKLNFQQSIVFLTLLHIDLTMLNPF